MRYGTFDDSSTRREFLTAASLACLGGLTRSLPGAAQSQPQVTTAFKELRGNVGIFTGRGGTMGWFVSKDAVAVIDSMFPDMAKICLEGLNQRSGNRKIDCLMITHHHGDHTGGNGVFRPVTMKIVAHEKVPELLKAAAAQQKSDPQDLLPNTTFSATWTSELGKEKAILKHYAPAHTGGDAVIHFQKANIVHMGDLVFNRRHPYIDKPAGASIAGWIEVLEKIAGEHSRDTLYIYGHAQQGFEITGTRQDLMVQRDYLTALLDFVRAGIKDGKSEEAILGINEPLKGFPDHGPLIKRVLQAAYTEIKA